MSIDLAEPIATARTATQAVQRHAADAVDLARNVDLQIPAGVARRAEKQARRAAKHVRKEAKHVRREVDKTSKRAVRRVQAEADRHTRAPRGRRALIVLAVVGASAGVVFLLARRLRQEDALELSPDPFGRGVAATEQADQPDGNSIVSV